MSLVDETTASPQSAVIREVDKLIEAYTSTLEAIRHGIKLHEANLEEQCQAEREKAYRILSTTLDSVDVEPADLAESFQRIHMYAIRLLWSDRTQHWATAARILKRLHDSCVECRDQASVHG